MVGIVSTYTKRLSKYLGDRTLEEIVACRPGELLAYKKGATEPKVVRDDNLTEEFWRDLASALANRERRSFDEDNPHLSVMLDGAHRAAFSIGPSVSNRVAVAIRLFRPTKFEYSDFGFNDNLSEEFKEKVRSGANILISGATSSGKTSLLRRAAKDIPLTDRLITVEDVRELVDLPHTNITQYTVFEGQGQATKGADYASVMDIAMRMRPDRILAGELRIDNSWSVMRLLNTGHRGFMATLHAESCRGALMAIETMIGMAGHPNEGVRSFLEEMIDLVIQVKRDPISGRRVVSEVLDLSQLRSGN